MNNLFKQWFEKMAPPSSEKFFLLLKKQSDQMFAVAEMLKESVTQKTLGTTEFTTRIHASENVMDALTDAILMSVRHTMIHPVDPDDLRRIADRMDSVVDTMDHFAWRMESYKLAATPSMEQMIGVIHEMAREMPVIFDKLLDGDHAEVQRRYDVLAALEKRADGIFHAAVRQLHAAGERCYTVEDEVIAILEMCADQCEDAGMAVVVMLERNG